MIRSTAGRGRPRAVAALCAAILAGLALTGCGVAGEAAPPQPSAEAGPVAGENCGFLLNDGKQVRFGEESYLAGILVGTGTTGVVLSHEANSDLCSWIPYANVLADSGYRVLAMDFAFNGASGVRPDDARTNADDMVVAAEYLRSQGVTKVVLMGASMGGTAAVGAAVMLQPPPAGVIALSAPTGFARVDAEEAAPKLTCPALYIVGDADGGFTDAARALGKASPDGIGTVLMVDSMIHGSGLIDEGAEGGKVKKAVEAFLAEHAPVT